MLQKKKQVHRHWKLKDTCQICLTEALAIEEKKKLYQQMKRTHEHMLTSSKIPTKKQKQSALNNF